MANGQMGWVLLVSVLLTQECEKQFTLEHAHYVWWEYSHHEHYWSLFLYGHCDLQSDLNRIDERVWGLGSDPLGH